MPKFEKKFAHFMWNDELKGKKVFYSDYIDSLKEDVENNGDSNYVMEEGNRARPFLVDCDTWAFVYYDPNYELKLAYEQGKTIQFRDNENYEWQDIKTPDWRGGTEYRIKPEEEPITNREFARWLAEGKGQWTRSSDGFYNCLTDVEYKRHRDEDAIDYDILVRKWEDTEWVKPTREYMGLED